MTGVVRGDLKKTQEGRRGIDEVLLGKDRRRRIPDSEDQIATERR